MKYLLQLILIIIFIIVERYYTKQAMDNIANKIPYKFGALGLYEVSGNKAIIMYKVNIIIIRLVIIFTTASFIIIDLRP